MTPMSQPPRNDGQSRERVPSGGTLSLFMALLRLPHSILSIINPYTQEGRVRALLVIHSLLPYLSDPNHVADLLGGMEVCRAHNRLVILASSLAAS